MIDIQKLKIIIVRNCLTDIEMLSIIRRFIYDLKNEDVGEIKRPINMNEAMLMNSAYNTALGYYLSKMNAGEI